MTDSIVGSRHSAAGSTLPSAVIAVVAGDRPNSISQTSVPGTVTVNAKGPVQVTEISATRASTSAAP
ncbi:hypothetical protein [Nocardia grenadensis]